MKFGELLKQSLFDKAKIVVESMDVRTRYEIAKEMDHRGDLPLHTALRKKGSDNIILSLLASYEDAVYIQGANNDLPLHIACKTGASAEVIELIIRIHPFALDVRNLENKCPREIGHKDVYVTQCLQKPIICWLELAEDEEREERQDKVLDGLHKELDDMLQRSSVSTQRLNEMNSKLEKMKKTTDDFYLSDAGLLEEKLSTFESIIVDRFDKTEDQLCIFEDNIASYKAREFFAHAAFLRSSLEIRMLQKTVQKSADNIVEEIQKTKDSYLGN